MEVIRIVNNAAEFDAAIRSSPERRVLPEAGDLAIICKPNATQGGMPGACLTFTVGLPDGTTARAQAVTTVQNLLAALHAIEGWVAGGHL